MSLAVLQRSGSVPGVCCEVSQRCLLSWTPPSHLVQGSEKRTLNLSPASPSGDECGMKLSLGEGGDGSSLGSFVMCEAADLACLKHPK